MKKLSTMCIGGLFIFVIVISLMLTPFVGAYHAITHPIETTVDFVKMIVGDVSDIFGDKEITIDDMDILVSVFYERNKNKNDIDDVIKSYNNEDVTIENLLKPFIFSQVDINKTTLNSVADVIINMKPYEDEKIIDYILSHQPFSSSLKEHEIDRENLEYLYKIKKQDNKTEYIPSVNDPIGDKVVNYAKSKLGCRYWWGATGPTYFDCSGLVYWVHNKAGVKIPRLTAKGYSQSGKSVPFSALQSGDIITFNYGRGVAHVGIYIGNGKMIHASGQGSGTLGQYPNQCVKISSIAKGSYFYRNMYNCRRLY